MTEAKQAIPPRPTFTKPQRIAVVHSAWHRDAVLRCLHAFLEEITQFGIAEQAVDFFEVPGAFEIPLHAQLLAKTRRYTALAAAALVMDDGVFRQEFIAGSVIDALMDVQLRTEVPVLSAVMTLPQGRGDAELADDFAARGRQLAHACAHTLLSLEQLRGQVAAGIV